MNLIQEAIEAAETQDICGNHNSADLLRRLVGYITDEVAMSGALAKCLRDGVRSGHFDRAATRALTAHAKRREADE